MKSGYYWDADNSTWIFIPKRGNVRVRVGVRKGRGVWAKTNRQGRIIYK